MAKVNRALSEDALETSKLVIELLHTVQSGPASGGSGHDGVASTAVSPHAVRASIHLYQHGQRTIGELASGLGISLGWASRVVSELETTGLAVRETDPQDRRVTRVKLSPAAMAMVEDTYRWRGDAIERALGGLDAEGRAAVQEFLRRTIAEFQAASTKRK